MKRQQQGFTLVEIAIVLVIIGLLLSGILKGQAMIVQATIKNAIAEFSGVAAAYYGYNDRYGALPGDDPKANRWAGGEAGTGDGVVAGTYNGACPETVLAATSETCKFWDHLRRAGFVAGMGGRQPFNASTGFIGVQTGDGNAVPASILPAPGPTGFTGLMICSANLPDKISISIDTQMDDGVPGTGMMRGIFQTTSNPPVTNATAPPGAYAETGTNTYALCRAF